MPKAILDLIGRGVSKPGEIAGRLGIAQSNLSRPLALLLNLGFVHRDIPYGRTMRDTKKVLHSIQDPALSFFYGAYLPQRSQWVGLRLKDRENVLNQHVSRQREIFCRQKHVGSGRYWEDRIEIDMVYRRPGTDEYLIGECKWARMGAP